MKAFIPGWCYRASIFESMAPEKNAVLIDYPRLPDVSLDLVTEYFASQLSDNSHLVGWSLGGLFAINIAANYPQKIGRLSLYATTPCFVANENWLGVSPKMADDFLKNACQNIERLLHKFTTMVDFPARKQTQQYVDVESQCALDYLNILLQSDLRQQYAAIQASIDFVYGTKDAVVKVDPLALKKLNAKTSLSIKENAGHAVFLGGEDDASR